MSNFNWLKNDYRQFIPLLTDIWPNISAGDSLTLLIKDQKSFFYFNDTYIGHVENESFGPLFLSIWLSPKTSQKSLRKKLLGVEKS